MITVKFIEDDRGCIRLTIKGHSGAAPAGQDLICAGVTTLAYTAAQAVRFYESQGKLRQSPIIHLQEGEAEITAEPLPDTRAELLLTYWTIQCGIHVLSQSYPDHVQLDTPLRIKD